MLEKLELLLSDDQKREEIAVAGYFKVYSAGHDVNARMKGFLNQIVEYCSRQK